MTDAAKRGGPRDGAGRKPKAASGEVMQVRKIRMTDAQWADAKLIGDDAVRELIVKTAARLRKLQRTE